ncbi:hypothetical protein JW707_01325 [Candidatus Woesearchaeota archaeon]|nr:hypothetical protein [Candidatus Woesearchaeota archaeon]
MQYKSNNGYRNSASYSFAYSFSGDSGYPPAQDLAGYSSSADISYSDSPDLSYKTSFFLGDNSVAGSQESIEDYNAGKGSVMGAGKGSGNGKGKGMGKGQGGRGGRNGMGQNCSRTQEMFREELGRSTHIDKPNETAPAVVDEHKANLGTRIQEENLAAIIKKIEKLEESRKISKQVMPLKTGKQNDAYNSHEIKQNILQVESIGNEQAEGLEKAKEKTRKEEGE